ATRVTTDRYEGLSFSSQFEKYIEIPSDRVPFEERPWMQAARVTDAVIDGLQGGAYKVLRLNYANGDMVGHTGVMEAAIIAVETVDQCVGDLLKIIDEQGGIAVITADHGNSDEMFTKGKDNRKSTKTAHTLNPVPFVIYDPNYKDEYDLNPLENAGLSNVAATLLNLLGYEKVEDYDPSLIRVK
ncbi:MAG: 2,3-bisphosphoglycerate-independent phosphoglycerate mutase, partial [Anaerolineales bacterium]